MKVVHCKKEPYDIYIGRGSPWGNPYTHNPGRTLAKYLVETREQAINGYRRWIMEQPELLARLPELKGKTLGCFCAPKHCHGDVLVELVEQLE